MRTRYPGYNVLDKWNTQSFNAKDREVLGKRLHDVPPRRFFTDKEWKTLSAICDCVIPQQPGMLPRVPIPAFIDDKMEKNQTDGQREADMPPMRECWRIGLRAIDDEAQLRFGARFRDLPAGRQETILELVYKGEVKSPEWTGMPPKKFFKSRVLHDTVTFYYGHPAGWNDIGYGGPASIRGYVRLGFDKRDAWEAKEANGE